MIPFSYSGIQVRTRVEKGEPWFCLADVGAVLGMRDPGNFLKTDWCDQEGVVKLTEPTNRGAQELVFINEPNLYALVMRSTKQEAKAFSKWVTHEVLPEIRKTGSYSIAPVTDPFLAMLDGVKTLYVQQQELAARQSHVENRIDLLEREREESAERMMALPAEVQEPRQLSTRELCRQAVDELVRLTGVGHQETWRKVYREYDFQARVNLTVRSQRKRIGKLDWVEKYGDLELLYGIIKGLTKKVA